MKLLKLILILANKFISITVVLSLTLAGSYAAYGLWDNNRIYASADNVQEDMLKLKPLVEEDEEISFEELLAINPDVVGWISLDNTKIDYPVLQGRNNLSYINTDVYGDFSLAGSIFLDTRNDPGFNDIYSLIYGHHMEKSKMFGDLDLYKDKSFFSENKTGTLILTDTVYDIEIISCLIAPSGEKAIFEPPMWQDNLDELEDFILENSLHLNEDNLKRAFTNNNKTTKILALTTCSSEFTDARTVLITSIKPSNIK